MQTNYNELYILWGGTTFLIWIMGTVRNKYTCNGGVLVIRSWGAMHNDYTCYRGLLVINGSWGTVHNKYTCYGDYLFLIWVIGCSIKHVFGGKCNFLSL